MKTSIRRIVTQNGLTGSLPGLYARNHYMRPLFDGEDGGVDDGGAGDGGGDGLGAGDGGAGDGGTPQFKGHTFTDENAEVMLPGMKTAVKVKDLAQALNLRDQHGKGLETMGQIAKALKKNEGQQGNRGGQQRQQQQQTGDGGKTPPKSVLDKLDAMDLLDGKSVATVLREYETGTVTPMMRALVAMHKEMTELKGHVTGMRGQGAEADFSSEIKSAITSLNLPRIDPNTPIEGEEILQEMVRDLYFSYDEADQPKLKGEVLQRVVKERMDAILKFAKNYQKAELATANKRMRDARFVRPGANSSGNGKGRKMLSNGQAAAALFAGSDGANA